MRIISKRMGNIKIIRGVFDTKLELERASVMAGFPSPADDYRHETLDFNRDYIKHPEASFYGEVEGNSMIGLGIDEGDIAVIDRALEAEHGDIVVAYIEGDFNVKQLDLSHKKDGYIELKLANPNAPNFRIEYDDNFRVWGVVIFTIKKWK